MRIELTGSQVQKQLGVSGSVLRRMVRDGILTPINERREGTKHFYPLFNPADIRAYIKSRSGVVVTAPAPVVPVNGNGTNGHHYGQAMPVPAVTPVTPAAGIQTQLETISKRMDSIEAVLQALLSVWK